VRPTLQTAHGGFFDLDRPSRSRFTIEEVAHQLSMICRFGGACAFHYSVAQHSVLVASLLPPELQYEGLMHDAHEAFVGDMTNPAKPMLPDYRKLERSVEQEMRRRFGLPSIKNPEVKRMDLVAMATERAQLMAPTPSDSPHDWACIRDVAPAPVKIMPCSPEVAARRFLVMYRELRP